jgi:Tfp pilus assembly protein PilF
VVEGDADVPQVSSRAEVTHPPPPPIGEGGESAQALVREIEELVGLRPRGPEGVRGRLTETLPPPASPSSKAIPELGDGEVALEMAEEEVSTGQVQDEQALDEDVPRPIGEDFPIELERTESLRAASEHPIDLETTETLLPPPPKTPPPPAAVPEDFADKTDVVSEAVVARAQAIVDHGFDESDTPTSGSFPIDLADEPPLTREAAAVVSALDVAEDLSSDVELDEVEAEAEEPDTAAPRATPPPVRDPVDVLFDKVSAQARGGDVAARVQRLEQELAIEQEPGRQAALIHACGVLEEVGLKDEKAALQRYADALKLDPTLSANVWSIRRLLYARQLWPNLIKLLDAELKYAAESPAARARLHVEKGHVLEDQLREPANARQEYEAALAEEPGCLRALIALERSYARDRDPSGRRRVLRALATYTEEPARKVSLLLELASIEDSVDERIALLGEAEAVGVGRERVLEQILRVAEQARRAPVLEAAIERKATLVAGERPAEAAALLRWRAQLARAGGDVVRTAEFIGRALELMPGDPILLVEASLAFEAAGRSGDAARVYATRIEQATAAERPALELGRARLLQKDGQVEAAARALEAAQRDSLCGHLVTERQLSAQGDAVQMAALAREESERAEAGGFGVPADRDWAAAAATLAGEIDARYVGDEANALASLRKALSLRPGYRPAVAAFDALLLRGRQYHALCTLLEEERTRPGISDERADYLDESLARYYGGEARSPERAIEALGRLTARYPTDARLRGRLAGAYAEAGHWPELARELAVLAEHTTADERVHVQLACAEVLADRVGDVTGAERMYRAVLSARPGDAVAAAAIEDLLRRGERWEELVELLLTQARAAPASAHAALYKVAEIEDGRDASRAATIYRALTAKRPEDRIALAALGRALGRAGDESGRAAALAQEVLLLTDAQARAHGLTRLGELYEDRLGDDGRAEEAYARAAEHAPGLYDAQLGLIRVRARRRDEPQLADAYAKLALSLPEGDSGRALYDAEARLLRGDVTPAEAGALPRLVAAAEQAAPGVTDLACVAAGETSDDTLASALVAAAGLFEFGPDTRRTLAVAHGRHPASVETAWLLGELQDESLGPEDAEQAEARARLLLQQADAAQGDMRAALSVEAAEMFERAGLPGQAARAAGPALKRDPRNVRALSLLKRVCERHSDWEGLWRVCANLGTALETPDMAVREFAAAARVLDVQLGRRRDAAPLLRQILERNPGDDALAERLHEILAETGDLRALEELITFRIEHAPTSGHRIPLHAERAELRLRSGDRTGAARDYHALLELDPDHLEGLRCLGELYAEDGHVTQAVHCLERLTTAPDVVPSLKHQAHMRSAELSESGLRDVLRATHHLKHAIELSPSDPAPYERLAQLYLRARDYPHAITVFRRMSQSVSDVGVRVQCEVRAAELYRDVVRDFAAARQSYEKALELEPRSVEIAVALAAVCERMGDMGAKAQVMGRALVEARGAVANEPTDAARARMLARIASACEEPGLARNAAEIAAYLSGEPADGARSARLPSPLRMLGAAARERLLAPELAGPWLDAWRLCAEALDDVCGHPGSAQVVGKSDRVAVAQMPQLAWFRELMHALGVTLDEVYLLRSDAAACLPYGVAPPSLALGSNFADAPAADMRYRLGRVLPYVVHQAAPLYGMAAEQARLWLGAIAVLAGAQPPRMLPPPQVDERVRRIDKVLARKHRKLLTALAPQLTAAGDPISLVRGFERASVRCGLVLAGQLEPAIRTTLGEPAPTGAAARVTAVGASTEALEVLRQHVSDDLITLLRELGWHV